MEGRLNEKSWEDGRGGAGRGRRKRNGEVHFFSVLYPLSGCTATRGAADTGTERCAQQQHQSRSGDHKQKVCVITCATMGALFLCTCICMYVCIEVHAYAAVCASEHVQVQGVRMLVLLRIQFPPVSAYGNGGHADYAYYQCTYLHCACAWYAVYCERMEL